MPQKVPALTAQEAVGDGLTVIEVLLVLEVVVLVLEVVVEVLEVVVEVLEVVVEVLEVVVEVVVTGTELPPGTRYQLASGSLRQVPAVTPFQPLAAMRPK